MKVLIIGIGSEVEPLGMMYVVGALKNAGHETRLQLIKNQVPFPEIPVERGYDFVGLSLLTGFHRHLLKLSHRYREAGVKTIAGGPHATFFPEECLLSANFVVRGEGINPILKIVGGGIKHDAIIKSEPIRSADQIPFPDRAELYRDPNSRDNPIKNMICSFGCPHSCAYCYNSLYNNMFPGFTVRQRSVDNVIREAKTLLQYPLETIFFQDDHFGLKIEWLAEFAEKWPREVGKAFHPQIRPESATDERLSLLKKAGCTGISVGIETYDEEYRRRALLRQGSNAQIFAGLDRIRNWGFKLRVYMMIGLPGRTIEDDLEDVRQNGIVQPNFVRTGVYIPLRGTVLGQRCVDQELWSGNDDAFSEMPVFDFSVLNLDPAHKRKVYWLQQVSYMISHLSYGYLVAREFLEIEEPTFSDFLRICRKYGMRELFGINPS